MIVTLREDLVASVQVAFPDTGQPDSFGQLVGHWEALSQGVVITWNEDEEAYPLPDLELEGTGNRLEGGGFHPCCEGGVELTLVRS